MNYPIILAHGTLGGWDEVIYLSIAVVFLVVMAVSWIKSRASEPLLEDSQQTDTPAAETDSPDHFPLE